MGVYVVRSRRMMNHASVSRFAAIFGLAVAALAPSAVLAADTTPPTVGSISPSTADADVAVTVYATVSDDVGVTSCKLINNAAGTQDVMSLGHGKAVVQKTYTPEPRSGGALLGCGRNQTDGPVSFINVSASDTTGPTVGAVARICRHGGRADDLFRHVLRCFGGFPVPAGEWGATYPMTLNSGTASVAVSLAAGSYSLQGQCQDTKGNWDMAR